MLFRIFLSPPHLDGAERELLLDAVDSNWVAPLGPHVDEFEKEVAAATGRAHAVALSSGTAGLHLGLLALGVGAGDDVIVPTLTFAATANAVAYVGARPVLVDADADTWNLDLDAVEQELQRRARAGERQPAALVPVDLYGRCVDYTALCELADRFAVPVLADAAESLGAEHAGRPAGAFGQAAVFSFAGNKIITTSGGGMLVTDDEQIARRVRHLATQAREPALHYQHEEIGFNYRLSNLLAAVGRGQFANLDRKVVRRRAINARYRARLAAQPDIVFPPADPLGQPTWWLTCLTMAGPRAEEIRDAVLHALIADAIEARPVWKPMHLQPVFADAPYLGGDVAERLFRTGMCLPSGSALADAEVDEIAGIVARNVSIAARR